MTNSRSTNNNQQNIPEIASYAIGKCIGSGQYGKVHRAVHKKSQTTVALKLINLSSRTRNDIKALRDEIKCHRRLIHPNIVRCLDCFTLRDNQEVAVVTELCSNGDLMEALKLTGPFDESRVGEFAIALIDGLEFLHTRHGIVHRDLKLQNILITESGILKIADFGFAQMFDQSKGVTMTSVKGTPIYMAPELIKEEPYSYLVDIWALGIILFERPTTTDSGIDIASEQPKAVSKLSLMNWFEVGGVEIGTQVEFPTECIQKEKLPDINWTRENYFLEVYS
ncbi:Serine/threonine-protein kinase 36 [Physocladia obscura]|uniref:non-specific serine/threonine protein kinase n=1 Tax=Physocladia obscura TaxID=109957 RepID=A0AAD5TAN4_9FUNG|nr:Serine/threonine-protein kinase 36 [Physocladia obscura]